MSNPSNPSKSKTPVPKKGDLASSQFRANQFSDQRRRDMATRSTLARLRNRKSALK
jgi:hypothetical protein